jgi:hypothetical protein
MALIDVAELMTDPDFVDQMSIIHRAPTVNDLGENELVEKCVYTVGSVQPTSGKTIQRLPEALRAANVKSFWIKGNIISSGDCKYPDILVFKNSRYQVQMVFDWTNWGQGWTEGVCVMEKPF